MPFSSHVLLEAVSTLSQGGGLRQKDHSVCDNISCNAKFLMKGFTLLSRTNVACSLVTAQAGSFAGPGRGLNFGFW